MIDLVLDGPGKNALSTALMRELLVKLDAAAGADRFTLISCRFSTDAYDRAF